MVRRIGSLLLVASVVLACSASGARPSSAPSTTPVPAGSEPAAVLASPAAPDAPASSPPAETWDLLWLSDSTGSGGTPWQYADHIRADVGVEVEVTDGWTMSLGIYSILDTIHGRNDGVLYAYAGAIELEAAIRDAEVIMVSGNPEGLLPADHTPCAGAYEPNPACSPPPTACGPETWAGYAATLQDIFDEIFRIREGKAVVLRTHDYYLPWGPHDVWKACDCAELCIECNRQMSDAIHRAAASRNVPVADYLETFSGPDRDHVLPKVSTPDGMHPTVEFSAELATVMAGLGYEPVEPVEPVEPAASD